MEKFKQARDIGGKYLLNQIHKDGSFGNPELGVTEYYKVPAALTVCGMSAAASRLLDWIRENGLSKNGDFGPRPPDTINNYYYTYYNSWVIKGAHRLGQFDLSNQGTRFLLNFWDKRSGGFYSSVNDRNEETEQDLWVVSGSAWCAIYTGNLHVAKGVGRWMRNLMDEQPNYPEQLWTVYSRSSGLVTEIRNNDTFRYLLDRDETRDQSFFHPGIAAGFLVELYQATGENEWLDLAYKYMEFCDYVGDYHFSLLRAGKVGWAASLLYTVTGDEKFRKMAIRVGNNLINSQSPKGFWEWSESGKTGPNNDATAELVVWLDEIHQSVGKD